MSVCIMTKPKNSAVNVCDICDFKATNSYIFKRHLHRCLSLHGIASKRSSPRNPIRLKGTEGLLSKDSSLEEVEEDSKDTLDHAEAISSKNGVELNDTEGQGQEEAEDIGKSTASLSSTSRSSTPSEKQNRHERDGEDVDTESQDTSLADDSSSLGEGSMPAARYSRLYSCQECSFETKGARDFLFHQRDAHFHKMKIFECQICDYASRYCNKIERHMLVHNKLIISMDDQGRKERASSKSPSIPKVEKQANAGGEEVTEDKDGGKPKLKVEPLKLKRLNVRMPFKVSGVSKLKSNTQLSKKKSNRICEMLKASTPSKTTGEFSNDDVCKMVTLEDGSHQYQCRDCLYWASIPSSVRKHHQLCHSKLLGCPHCTMTTPSQGIYYEHLMTHGEYGYVKCPDCSYVTNTKSNYEKHRSFHDGDFPVHCTVCNFGADSENKIKRHVAMQHPPAAELQSLSMKNVCMDLVTSPKNGGGVKATVEETLQQFGFHKGNAQGSGDGQGEYRCPKCPMVCYRRGNFTRHLTAKHKFNQINAATLSRSMELKMIKVLKLRRGTTLANAKQSTGENLKCSHCSYIAKWPSDLRRHMQVHTIVKRFKCGYCPNKYKYLGDLNVHMRRDHNMEPPENAAREYTTVDTGLKASPAQFRCPICLFSTNSKADLEQHTRSHGNIEKTYQCRLCEYQTYWRGDVGRHLFRHHKIILSREATEIGQYFIHKPEIRPLTKQSSSSGNGSLPPSPSPDPGIAGAFDSLDTPEFIREGTPDSVTSSSSKKQSGQNSVALKDGSFVCEYSNCDFKTTVSDRMETHMAVHLNLKQFMCPTCGKRTNWKWDIVKHLHKIHSNMAACVEDVITLTIDEAKTTIDDYLTNFERKSKEVTMSYCSLCCFKSVERNRVVRHMGTDHRNENGKVITESIVSGEELEGMSDLSTDRELLSPGNGDTKHPNDGSSDMSRVPTFVEPPAEELAKFDKPYACALCKKPGSTKGDVKKHYNYTHPYKDVRVLYVGDGTEFNYYTGEIYQTCTKPNMVESPDSHGSPSLSPSGKALKADSKFSNPKMHGYVKPFKCSICGLRSNWKWDLKKHLRSKHPNEGGFVIMLSIEEASETYGKDCTPSHPKNEGLLSISPSPSLSASSPSPIPSLSQPVFKQPPSVKGEILSDSTDSLPSFFPQSPASMSFSSTKQRKSRDQETYPDPERRQWKCSGCNYISNWRRNMARHIHRKHFDAANTVKIIPLNKDKPDIRKKPLSSAGKSYFDDYMMMDEEDSLSSELQNLDHKVQKRNSTLAHPDMRLWQCSQCSFSSRLRTHIIIHMQGHSMKPFMCGVCNEPFMNRGPLHRHLQKIHKRNDYVKLTRVNIQYNDCGDTDVNRGDYINSYFCRLCNSESESRQDIIQHLEQAHNTKDFESNILKIQKHVGGTPVKKSDSAKGSKRLKRKFHFCTLCPYRSQKKAMLSFHMSYHKPSAVNKLKCKFCPYYVSALRLLHQHQKKWHQDGSNSKSWEDESFVTPPSSPSKIHRRNSGSGGTPRKHACEKCPYTTNSKNDFIYHKQFHRPKRTAEYKCEYCDYWVVHKRLLKQHMRLHTESSTASSLECSPAKSLYSDPGLVYDPVELTELAAIKQKMISAKITASLSKSPNISPMKLASQCAVDDKPNYVMKNGLYRKLHKCRYCPYTNIRSRNMQLHEMMHGPRESTHPLLKCRYCDYYVGSKGLLSHHMKVHSKDYGGTAENDVEMAGEIENGEESEDDISQQNKVDTLLQISRFKRFGCERCPYASAKRQHFERHLELHGSRQRYTCQYCDYSVPSNNLLLQHTKLHMMPNQNLLASQSVTNLQHLSEVPADVALASALPPADSDTTVTISVIHDHLGLYENSILDPEPKKLYRCDRCPYANVRRDYLLSHLKFHMVPSALVCPYCDYSAPKQPLLTQHIRVHFCPLPELSDWLLENGQMERVTSHRNMDLAEALKVAHEYQNQSKKKGKGKADVSDGEKATGKEEKPEGKENIQGKPNGEAPLTYICQYCDREFQASDKLVKHELQHLIGNHFEATMQVINDQLQLQQQLQQQQQEQLEEERWQQHQAEQDKEKQDYPTKDNDVEKPDENLQNQDKGKDTDVDSRYAEKEENKMMDIETVEENEKETFTELSCIESASDKKEKLKNNIQDDEGESLNAEQTQEKVNEREDKAAGKVEAGDEKKDKEKEKENVEEKSDNGDGKINEGLGERQGNSECTDEDSNREQKVAYVQEDICNDAIMQTGEEEGDAVRIRSVSETDVTNKEVEDTGQLCKCAVDDSTDGLKDENSDDLKDNDSLKDNLGNMGSEQKVNDESEDLKENREEEITSKGGGSIDVEMSKEERKENREETIVDNSDEKTCIGDDTISDENENDSEKHDDSVKEKLSAIVEDDEKKDNAKEQALNDLKVDEARDDFLDDIHLLEEDDHEAKAELNIVSNEDEEKLLAEDIVSGHC